jgi:SAM-dependent methyltransferase
MWIERLIKIVVYGLPLFDANRFCPICGRFSRKFGKYGIIPRDDAECTWCGSLERHRLVWLYLTGMTDIFDDRKKRMLHVAPEACLEKLLKTRIGSGYLTADLDNQRAMEKIDIQNIQHPSDSFDIFICSHVLEHVPDDIRAMREIYRVLRPSGWGIFLVPITSERTIEDPSITDKVGRKRLFGQEDHVRRYGPDFKDRLCKAGFKVKVIAAHDILDERELLQKGITDASGDIYYCTI